MGLGILSINIFIPFTFVQPSVDMLYSNLKGGHV